MGETKSHMTTIQTASYSTVTVVLYIRDHEELGFSSQTYHPKPASISLHDSLAALVRHSQAQKCLQTSKVSMEF